MNSTRTHLVKVPAAHANDMTLLQQVRILLAYVDAGGNDASGASSEEVDAFTGSSAPGEFLFTCASGSGDAGSDRVKSSRYDLTKAFKYAPVGFSFGNFLV
jgi:hypothetical protein